MDKGSTLSLQDERMGKRIKGLFIPTNKQCGERKGKKDSRENMRWTPPQAGWININFDGAVKGNLEMGGIFIVLLEMRTV